MKRLFVLVWLLLGCALLATAFYLQSQYPVPVVGERPYGISSRNGVVAWVQDPHNMKPDRVYHLDLKTGQIGTSPYRIMIEYGTLNSRGQRIVFQRELEVTDDKTGEVLWAGELPQHNKEFQTPALVGDSYLVEELDDKFCITDLDKLMGLDLAPTQRLQNPLEAQTTVDTPGVVMPKQYGTNELFPIEGTNRFLYHFATATPPRVAVFEVEDNALREIASWQVGKTTVVLYNRSILTAAPSNSEVEVRSQTDFEIIRKHPLPAGLKAWVGSATGPGISSRNDLFSYSDTTKGMTRVARLDDFTLIPELDVPVTVGGMNTDRSDDRRYVMLSDDPYGQTRLVVYDTVDRRIVFDRMPPPGVVDVKVVDGHLVFVNEAMGLTVERVDLTSGKTVQVYQPFAWVQWWMPFVLSLALVWVVIWIRASVQWSHLALCNILFLAAMFFTPQFLHVAMLGNFTFRPAVMFGLCLWLGVIFWLCVYAVFGRGPVLLRQIPLWLSIIAILAWSNLLPRDPITNLPVAGLSRMFAILVPLMISLAVVNCGLLWCIKSLQNRRLSKLVVIATDTPEKARISLRDIFLFTAVVAAFVAAAVPNQDVMLAAFRWIGLAIIAGVMTVPMLLGLTALVRPAKLYAILCKLAVGLAALLILQATLHLMLGHMQREIWYWILELCSYIAFLFLGVFTIGVLLRQQLSSAKAQT